MTEIPMPATATPTEKYIRGFLGQHLVACGANGKLPEDLDDIMSEWPKAREYFARRSSEVPTKAYWRVNQYNGALARVREHFPSFEEGLRALESRTEALTDDNPGGGSPMGTATNPVTGTSPATVTDHTDGQKAAKKETPMNPPTPFVLNIPADLLVAIKRETAGYTLNVGGWNSLLRRLNLLPAEVVLTGKMLKDAGLEVHKAATLGQAVIEKIAEAINKPAAPPPVVTLSLLDVAAQLRAKRLKQRAETPTKVPNSDGDFTPPMELLSGLTDRKRAQMLFFALITTGVDGCYYKAVDLWFQSMEVPQTEYGKCRAWLDQFRRVVKVKVQTDDGPQIVDRVHGPVFDDPPTAPRRRIPGTRRYQDIPYDEFSSEMTLLGSMLIDSVVEAWTNPEVCIMQMAQGTMPMQIFPKTANERKPGTSWRKGMLFPVLNPDGTPKLDNGLPVLLTVWQPMSGIRSIPALLSDALASGLLPPFARNRKDLRGPVAEAMAYLAKHHGESGMKRQLASAMVEVRRARLGVDDDEDEGDESYNPIAPVAVNPTPAPAAAAVPVTGETLMEQLQRTLRGQ